MTALHLTEQLDALASALDHSNCHDVFEKSWANQMEASSGDVVMGFRKMMFSATYPSHMKAFEAMIQHVFGSPKSCPQEHEVLLDLSSALMSKFLSSTTELYCSACSVLLSRQFSFGANYSPDDLILSDGSLWSKSLCGYVDDQSLTLGHMINNADDNMRATIQDHMQRGVIPPSVVLSTMLFVLSSRDPHISASFFETIPTSICATLDEEFRDVLDRSLELYMEGELEKSILSRLVHQKFALEHMSTKFNSALVRLFDRQVEDLQLLCDRIAEAKEKNDDREQQRLRSISRSSVDMCVHLLPYYHLTPIPTQFVQCCQQLDVLDRYPPLMALYDKMVLTSCVDTDPVSPNRVRKI